MEVSYRLARAANSAVRATEQSTIRTVVATQATIMLDIDQSIGSN